MTDQSKSYFPRVNAFLDADPGNADWTKIVSQDVAEEMLYGGVAHEIAAEAAAEAEYAGSHGDADYGDDEHQRMGVYLPGMRESDHLRAKARAERNPRRYVIPMPAELDRVNPLSRHNASNPPGSPSEDAHEPQARSIEFDAALPEKLARIASDEAQAQCLRRKMLAMMLELFRSGERDQRQAIYATLGTIPKNASLSNLTRSFAKLASKPSTFGLRDKEVADFQARAQQILSELLSLTD